MRRMKRPMGGAVLPKWEDYGFISEAVRADAIAEDDLSQNDRLRVGPGFYAYKVLDLHTAYQWVRIRYINRRNLTVAKFHTPNGNDHHDNFLSFS